LIFDIHRKGAKIAEGKIIPFVVERVTKDKHLAATQKKAVQ